MAGCPRKLGETDNLRRDLKDIKLRKALKKWLLFQFVDVAKTKVAPKNGRHAQHPLSVLLKELSATPNTANAEICEAQTSLFPG